MNIIAARRRMKQPEAGHSPDIAEVLGTAIAAPLETPQKDAAIDNLEKRLEEARDRHLQERFGWIMLFLLMFDAFVFIRMETWSGPFALLILELVIVIVVARACGVEDVVELVTQLVKRLGDRAADHGNKS